MTEDIVYTRMQIIAKRFFFKKSTQVTTVLDRHEKFLC